MERNQVDNEINRNTVYNQKCKQIMNSLKDFDQLLESYISLRNINAINEIINFIEVQLSDLNVKNFTLDINTLNEVEYNYFKSMRRLAHSSTYRICQYMFDVNKIFMRFFRIHFIENQMNSFIINLSDELEYKEWAVFFQKDIMQQLTELFLSTKFEYAYSLDSLIRGLRVIEENIMFMLLVLECPRKMWNPQIIIRLYDHRRNQSRLELINDSIVEGEIIFHNGVPKQRKEYINDIKKQSEDFNQYYKREFDKLRKIGEQKIKKELNFNNKDIQRIKTILSNKNKQKKREQLYKIIVIEKRNKYSKKLTKSEFLYAIEKKLEFLVYSFPVPNNIYMHIKNVFIVNGIIYKGDVSTISGFHQYMKDYSTTSLITKLESDIEINLSSHIMLDGMMFSEKSVLFNKTLPIKNFTIRLDENIVEYYTLLLSAYTRKNEMKKLLDIFKEVS